MKIIILFLRHKNTNNVFVFSLCKNTFFLILELFYGTNVLPEFFWTFRFFLHFG